MAKTISDEERRAFNVQIPTHGLALECKIKHMYFFQDDKGKFNKKTYCYVKYDDELVVKGLTVVKVLR